MINGKKIEVVAVSTGEQVIMCTAPYMASLWTGDTVVVEGVDGFCTVLIRDSVTIGEEEYEAIEKECELKRILRKVDFTDLKWEDENE